MKSFLRYVFKKTLKNMKRDISPTISSIFIMGTSIFIFLTFSLVAFNLDSQLKARENRFEIIAYLKKGTPIDEVEILLKKIRKIEGVEAVNYISPFEAMEFMESKLGNQKDLLEGIKPNIFPASMEIRLGKDYWGQTKLNDVVSELKKVPQIEEIQYGKEWIETFSVIVFLVRITQWIIGGILILTIIFIVSNTLQLTISSRGDEIEIMYMLGASPSYIRIPFYIEGLIQGLLGAAMAVGLLFIMYKVLILTVEPMMKGWMAGIKILFFPRDRIIWFLLCGVLIGLFGSFISSIKFLRYAK